MYKVGVVGLGQIAYHIDKDPNRKIIWSHINAYQAIKSTNIIAICDINESLVLEIGQECGINSRYTNYNTMLEENNFDIVSICTPIQTHYEIVKKCVETGVKAIFCEKTLSFSLSEAQEIERLCRENNVILAVNHILRWDSINQEIKKLLENNVIGKIYSMVGYGATALHTSTSHLIDLMVFFADSKPKWVVGEKQKDFIRIAHGVKDHGGMGLIKFETGIMGFIKGTSSSPYKYMLELDILGEKGRIKLYNNGFTYDLFQYSTEPSSAGTNYESLRLVQTVNKERENERMVDAVLNIISCLENGGQPLANGASSINSIKIIEGLKLSNDIGNVVFFD